MHHPLSEQVTMTITVGFEAFVSSIPTNTNLCWRRALKSVHGFARITYCDTCRANGIDTVAIAITDVDIRSLD